MLRSKGLTDKMLLLGIDGMDPRFARVLVDEGKMPNLKKLMEKGACREDLRMLGANPTITPPMWATLATGAYPMTHGIMDYNLSAENDKDVTIGAFSSRFLKAEPLWNVTAEEGKKTLVMQRMVQRPRPRHGLRRQHQVPQAQLPAHGNPDLRA